MQMTFKDLFRDRIPPEAAIAAAFAIILAVGYGVWSSETFGTITLKAPVYGTSVVVDNEKTVLRNEGDEFTAQFAPGAHTVIVSRGGYWPWTRTVKLESKDFVKLEPFLVRQEIVPDLIAPEIRSDAQVMENPEYSSASLLFLAEEAIPPELSPLITQTGVTDIRFAAYFPGRKDVLLIAVKDGVYAIETAKDASPRNFQPVYKGTSPIFVLTAKNILYVQDSGSIYRITGFSR